MKLQLPHFRGGVGVTPNAGSAISAFYAASVSFLQWLGFCNYAEQNSIDLASTFQRYRALREARGDFLAPILAPTVTAVLRPLNQASGSNVPASLLPCSRVNDNNFPGLSSGSDGEYCTWLNKTNLAPLLVASSYKLFDAGPFQGTFDNPALYSALGAPWSANGPTTNLFMHEGSLQLFACRHSISRRLNRPISISLPYLCHLTLSVIASTTRPGRLTHVKNSLLCFIQQWRYCIVKCLGHSIRASRSTATGSPPFNLLS